MVELGDGVSKCSLCSLYSFFYANRSMQLHYCTASNPGGNLFICWLVGDAALSLGQRQPQEQCYPFLSMCAVFSCVQTMVWLPMFGIFNVCTDVTSTHAIAHWGCTGTVRESVLEDDSGRKIPCRTWDSNPRQYCDWFFNRTLCQPSYPRPHHVVAFVVFVTVKGF